MRNEYRGIDYFRFVSAILVITIHTSPLLSYQPYADFILTRIIARVAVLFFLMTTGFFLFKNLETTLEKMKVFTKKMAVLYGISIVIYLPVNWYMGDLHGKGLGKRIVEDIFFQGTMYHLWYFPATILGVWVVYFLLKRLGKRRMFFVGGVLYVIGLFGDSYYGLTEGIPLLKNMYQFIFSLFGYTRNGLFYVPVFIMLGAWLSEEKTVKKWKIVTGMAVSLGGMIAEGVILHTFDMQRHDSMYILLLPCMVCLFQLLLFWKGKRNRHLGKVALCIYVIHPLVIIGVRGVAKVLHLENLFVENSLCNFLIVTLVSVAASICITYGKKEKR